MRKMWSGRPPGAQTAKREVLPPMSARRTLVIERETPPLRTNADTEFVPGTVTKRQGIAAGERSHQNPAACDPPVPSLQPSFESTSSRAIHPSSPGPAEG